MINNPTLGDAPQVNISKRKNVYFYTFYTSSCSSSKLFITVKN